MKTAIYFVVVLAVGLAGGWFAHSSHRSQILADADISKLPKIDWRAMWGHNCAEHALHDMSVLSSLDTNDVLLARNQLLEDLDDQVYTLTGKDKTSQSSYFTTNVESDEAALTSAKTFLEKSKR